MTKAQSRKEALEKHYALCKQLGKITGSKLSGKKISNELFKLEKLAHDGATAYNNGERYSGLGFLLSFDFGNEEGAWERFTVEIEKRLKTILGSVPKGFFVNGDARGYALKLEPKSIDLPLYEDWGSFQILSPTIK